VLGLTVQSSNQSIRSNKPDLLGCKGPFYCLLGVLDGVLLVDCLAANGLTVHFHAPFPKITTDGSHYGVFDVPVLQRHSSSRLKARDLKSPASRLVYKWDNDHRSYYSCFAHAKIQLVHLHEVRPPVEGKYIFAALKSRPQRDLVYRVGGGKNGSYGT
jgi:hypothetical protein